MTDRQARVAVIGSLNMDVVVQAARLPQIGETVTGDSVYFIPGGKGANQAVSAARLGASTVMVGSVGTDSFGQTLLESLEQSGVDIQPVKRTPDAPTGVASIWLSEGDNSIVVVPGANSRCLPDDVRHHQERIAESEVVVLQLEIPMETVMEAARTAKELGKIVVLNPAPATKLPQELYQWVDVLTPNRSELERLSGYPAEEGGLEQGMQTLLHKGVSCVVTTLGEQGAVVLSKEEGFRKVAGRSVHVVDTTGAGDAFNAGLACALAEGKPLFDAVDFAGCVASLAVTRLGAQNGMPSRKEVDAFYSKELEGNG
ncbi:ribokinase [Melghirimyces algeriensis]|uniref:Ribokinase n=1 Tax=Melghirimyces algeriensis TaxID=910412 RepID=A0A521F1G4_9BACL|nr:ribokinase [Melghirimyces algeriensis]SMO90044.1 ribokinase [Melghirimyces algeriensis]